MPIEYGVMLMITVGILAGAVYALYLKHQLKRQPGENYRSQFEDDVLEQLRRVKETGEPAILRERGWPTVEIHPETSDGQEPLGKLKGSVLRYEKPTDPID